MPSRGSQRTGHAPIACWHACATPEIGCFASEATLLTCWRMRGFQRFVMPAARRRYFRQPCFAVSKRCANTPAAQRLRYVSSARYGSLGHQCRRFTTTIFRHGILRRFSRAQHRQRGASRVVVTAYIAGMSCRGAIRPGYGLPSRWNRRRERNAFTMNCSNGQ